MASIKGEKQEIKPGFYQLQRETVNGRALAFYNETKDTQFNICYTFNEPHITVLGKTQTKEGNMFAVTVYPGETQEFVEGKWKGFKRSVSFGAPDAEWRAKQEKIKDEAIENEITALRELVKKFPKADGKYTAEYIGQLCIEHNVKFVDLTFPPKSTSLARDWEPQIGEFGWVRPEMYCTADQPPAIFVGDIEPNDIDQGLLGDCYYLCALACIAEFPTLVRDAFSLQQYPELGMYRVLVCKNGWWQVVVVDDFLPARNGRPCFARNREEPNELWVSLLEKAYAKLHGSYSAIKSGDAALSIADILGAPYKKLKQMPEYNDKEKLFYALKAADEQDDLMAIGTPATKEGISAEELDKQYESVGLTSDHAYSLLRVKEVQKHQLCMIRNPWGDEKEWNGAWSDDSSMWTPELQKAVGFYKGADGTFWMCWDDVMKYFDNGSVSRVLRDWPQLRVPGNFNSGTADLILLLTVKSPVECYFGCHQRDNRGLPSGDKDLKYAALLLNVVSEKPGGGIGADVLAETNQGNYSDTRDSFTYCKLEPRSTPYVVLVQPFDAVSKSFTLSMIMSDPNAFEKIAFATFTNKKKYNPPSRFQMADWGSKAVAKYQIRIATSDKAGMLLHHLTGDMVDLKALSSPVPPKPPVTIFSKQQPGAPAKFTDPKAAPAPPQQPLVVKPAEPSKTPKKATPQSPGSMVKLQMIILQGRNLVAKDSNGLSDPYITVKLKTPTGERLSNDQRHETRYIAETLSPIWCEVFNYHCNTNDIMCIKCWDKDMFGHDAMGLLNLPVSDIVKGLKPGGPAKIEWYPLGPPPDDASGEIQIAFSWTI